MANFFISSKLAPPKKAQDKMITINPCNVINLLWKEFSCQFESTNVITEREVNLSKLLQSIIESSMTSSSPLPRVIKSSQLIVNNNNFKYPSSPSSSSSNLDMDSPTQGKTGKNGSYFTAKIPQSEYHHSKSNGPLKVSPGHQGQANSVDIESTIDTKSRPAKPLRKVRISPVQHSPMTGGGHLARKLSHFADAKSPSSKVESNNNTINKDTSVNEKQRKQQQLTGDTSSTCSSSKYHKLGHCSFVKISSTQIVSSGVPGIPSPVLPSKVTGGCFNISQGQKSKSMAHLPLTSVTPGMEDKSNLSNEYKQQLTSYEGAKFNGYSVSMYGHRGEMENVSNSKKYFNVANPKQQLVNGKSNDENGVSQSEESKGPSSESQMLAKKKKTRQRLLQFLLRRPPIETLEEKGIIKDEPVFGCNLINLCHREKSTIPKFVKVIIAAIEVKNLKADGIYRICGNLSHVQKLRYQINQDHYNAIWKEEDVHILTGLFKMFLREMKQPLIPYSIFDSLMNSIVIDQSKRRIESVKYALDSINVCNYDTLKYILQHLLR